MSVYLPYGRIFSDCWVTAVKTMKETLSVKLGSSIHTESLLCSISRHTPILGKRERRDNATGSPAILRLSFLVRTLFNRVWTLPTSSENTRLIEIKIKN